eukprot:6806857-Pyramimonas_sp.AAC.1
MPEMGPAGRPSQEALPGSWNLVCTATKRVLSSLASSPSACMPNSALPAVALHHPIQYLSKVLDARLSGSGTSCTCHQMSVRAPLSWCPETILAVECSLSISAGAQP